MSRKTTIALSLASLSSMASDDFASEKFQKHQDLTEVVSARAPVEEDLRSFTLQQNYLALNRSMKPLRFLESTKLQSDLTLEKVKVLGWDIELKIEDKHTLTTIPREMARKFMRLWQEVEHGELSAQDKETWQHIVTHVDMDAFYLSVEQPRYLEGTLIGSPQQWYIQWPDEDRSQKIPKELSGEFSLMNRGEWFGAHLLLDAQGEIVDIKRVVPRPEPAADLLEDWPPVTS